MFTMDRHVVRWGLLLWVLTVTLGLRAQTTPMLSLDVRPPAGCLTCRVIRDYSTNTTIADGTVYQGHQMDFMVSNGLVFPQSPLIFAAPAATPGFTVVAQLGIYGIHANEMENVFSIKGSSGNYLFGIMRDAAGRWYVGKARDISGEGYSTQVWDPVSPCATKACTSDTLYASFLPNGQVVLDEIATVTEGGGRYDWQTGLLNYGLPVSGYQVTNYQYTIPGTSTNITVGPLTADPGPAQMPLFVTPSQVVLESLPTDPWKTGKVTDAAAFQRFAIYSGTPLIWPEPTNGGTTSAGIITDYNAYAGVSSTYGTLQQDWLPCTTGRFEQPAPTTGGSAQYWPEETNTPCNNPGRLRNAKVDVTDAVIASWDAPATNGKAGVLNGYIYAVDGGSWQLTNTPGALLNSLTSAGPHAISAAPLGIVSPVTAVGPTTVLSFVTAKPSAPLSPAALAQDGGLTVKWSEPEQKGGAPITGYDVVVSPGGYTISTTTTQATFSGLTNGTTYSAIIIPKNKFGSGTSAAVSGTPRTMPRFLAGAGVTGFKTCANEGQICVVTQSSTVAFGSLDSGMYFTINANQSILCDDSSFGGDPTYATYTRNNRQCFVASNPSPLAGSGNVFCAMRGDPCRIPAGATVTEWFFSCASSCAQTALASGSFVETHTCGNLSVISNYCSYSQTSAYPKNFSFCSSYNSTCSNSQPSIVSLMSGTFRAFMVQSSVNLPCLSSQFGGNPDTTGSGSQCFKAPVSSLQTRPSSSFVYCAGQYKSCFTNETEVAFGRDGYGWVYKQVKSATTCSLWAFNGVDVAPGQDKSCFYSSESSAQGPAGYIRCATEYGSCHVTQASQLAFGINGGFVYKAVGASGDIGCTSTSFFGLDPAVGALKSCFVRNAPTSPPGNWTLCASSYGASCNTSGFSSVAFGTAGAYHYAPKGSGSSVPCTKQFSLVPTDNTQNVFPSPNCYTSVNSLPDAANNATDILCALNEGDLCSLAVTNASSPYLVGYGSGTRFIYRSSIGGINCSNEDFAQDPWVGHGKYCFYRAPLTTPNAGTGNKYCSDENDVCILPDKNPHTVIFGNNNAGWFSFAVTGEVECKATSFYGSPGTGVKQCWYQ